MNALRNFGIVAGAVALGWLGWRLDRAIGSDGVLLLAGAVAGGMLAVCVAVIVWVVVDVRRAPAAPETHEPQPPVVLYLGDGSRTPYTAPAVRNVAHAMIDDWGQP